MTCTGQRKFVGRRPELAALLTSLDEATGGRVVICSVVGEMGVGRTSLVGRFSDIARDRGHAVLDIGRRSAGAAALSSLSVQLGVSSAPTVREAVGEAAATPPLVVLADDVDELDVETRAALDSFLAAATCSPLLLITTSSEGEGDSGWKVPPCLARPLHLDLRGLSVSETSSLVRNELGRGLDPRVVGELHRVSAGNPSMLSALLAEFSGDPRLTPKPSDVRAMGIPEIASSVSARVVRRDPDAAGLIRAAAVAGDDSELALLAHMSGLELLEALAAADALVQLRLVEDESRVRFRHPLLRTSLLATVTHIARDAAHLKAAQYLYRKHSSAERIARHLIASAVPLDEEWSTGVLLQAARTAVADGRTDQALRYLELAATASEPGLERNQALLELVEVSLKAGAGQGLAKAATILRFDCDDEVRLQVLSRLVAALWLVESDDDHLEILELVDTTAAGGALVAWVPVHEAAVASERRLPGDFVEHIGRMAVAGPPKPREHDGAPRSTALLGLAASAFVLFGRFLEEDDPAAVVELVDAAERLLSDPDDLCVHPVASLAMMAVLLWSGRYDRAEELLRVHRYCHLGRENHPQQLLLAFVEGRILRFRGQLGTAITHLTRCLDDLVGFGAPPDHVLRLVVVGVLADVLVETGDVATAWKLLKDHQCAGPLPVGRYYGDVLLVRARLHAVRGAFPEALEDLREARRRVGAELVDWSALRWRLVGADLMLRLGRYCEARTWAEAQARRAGEVGDVGGRAIAVRVLGNVTGGAPGEVMLREAAVVLEREQLWLQLAYALSDLGQLLAGEARWEEADAVLGRALALANRCGAAPLVASGIDLSWWRAGSRTA